MLRIGVIQSGKIVEERIIRSQETVTVGLRGDTASIDRRTFTLVPGVPAAISILPTPKQYTAGDNVPVTVLAKVLDKHGNPTPGALDLSSSFGELTDPRIVVPPQTVIAGLDTQ